MESPERTGVESVSAAKSIQRLLGEGFRISRVFKAEQNADFEAYLESLQASGKLPNADYAFVLGDMPDENDITVFEK